MDEREVRLGRSMSFELVHRLVCEFMILDWPLGLRELIGAHLGSSASSSAHALLWHVFGSVFVTGVTRGRAHLMVSLFILLRHCASL